MAAGIGGEQTITFETVKPKKEEKYEPYKRVVEYSAPTFQPNEMNNYVNEEHAAADGSTSNGSVMPSLIISALLITGLYFGYKHFAK